MNLDEIRNRMDRLQNKSNTLFDMFKSVMLPEKIDTEFLYPNEGGFGGFYDKLLELCQSYDNFNVVCDNTITELEDNGNNFNALTKKGETYSFDELIWSGNLNDLVGIISPDHQKVNYLNTIFYNIICKEIGIKEERSQWIYVSKGDSLVSRITCMKEFAPYTCKEGYYNMLCELTDSQANPIYFKDPDKYTSGILDEVVSMSIIKDTKYVEAVKINPVIDTYPIYRRSYIKDFASAAGTIKKYSKRIHLLGRCGAFW